jgi:hypothetical protein
MRATSLPPAILLLALLGACRSGGPGHDKAATVGAPVIREATVVAFVLPASDTLKPGEEHDGLDDFRGYTAVVAPLLADEEIAFVPTTADSIIIERSDGIRRVVMLGGLDYPYGYVLVTPGFAETILTGVLTDSELIDEVDWYFGTADESEGDDSSRRLSQALPASPRRQG